MLELLTVEEAVEEKTSMQDCFPDDEGCFPEDCGPANGCGPYCYP
jgi:hypothetical protein